MSLPTDDIGVASRVPFPLSGPPVLNVACVCTQYQRPNRPSVLLTDERHCTALQVPSEVASDEEHQVLDLVQYAVKISREHSGHPVRTCAQCVRGRDVAGRGQEPAATQARNFGLACPNHVAVLRSRVRRLELLHRDCPASRARHIGPCSTRSVQVCDCHPCIALCILTVQIDSHQITEIRPRIKVSLRHALPQVCLFGRVL
jgi:hypothetical protein